MDFGRWPVTSDGHSLYWEGLNKGKRSLVADFRSPEGRDLVTRLVAGSGPGGGIVLTNADRPWLSYEALSQGVTADQVVDKIASLVAAT